MYRFLICMLFTAGLGAPIEPKQPHYIYARPGDPLRFVYETGSEGSMGIVAEGPLAARCFVLKSYYRDLSLGEPDSSWEYEPRPRTELELASRLDLRPDELPADLIRIWRTGTIDWQPFQPGNRLPVDGVPAAGPHMVVGPCTYRIYSLADDRGYLLVAYYGPGMTRALRLRAPRKEYLIRPGSGLTALIADPDVYPSDVGRHLKDINRGRPVDWSDLSGYYN